MLILDDKFDPSTPESQQRLHDICVMLNDTAEVEFLNCFMLYFKWYAEDQIGEFPVP